MVFSNGVNRKPGSCRSILLLSNQVLLRATRALSRVSRGRLPENKDFIFSSRQAIALRKGVASR